MRYHNSNRLTAAAALPLMLTIVTACVSPGPDLKPVNSPPEIESTPKQLLSTPRAWNPAVANLRYRVDQPGEIRDRRAPEISGIAASNRAENTLWAINDSGNKPNLLAFKHSGNFYANWITSIENRDWEDLASFKYEGKPYLIVAETGDNLKAHKNYALHIFNEPQTDTLTSERKELLEPVTTLRFIYPDGPQNSEAIAVSHADNSIIIITKVDAGSASIYAVPLSLKASSDLITATKLGEIPELPQAPGDGLIAKLTGINFSAATAMDINPQDNTAVLLSYREVYRWTRKSAKQSWGSVFSQPPERIMRHSLQQAESLSFDAAGEKIYIVSERLPTPVLRLTPVGQTSAKLN